jgi:xanthine dehydrogenase molybdopterin-binding subunit B
MRIRNPAGRNLWSVSETPDEEVLPTSEVLYHGQIIGVIAAQSRDAAKTAAQLVRISYEKLESVLSLDEAVKAGERTVMGHDILLERYQDGKEKKSTAVDFQLEGRITTGAQEHYYLEPHSALAVPSGEKRELTLHFTTQEPSPVQVTIAAVLGLHQNKIIVKCKRTGGAFGGKERCQVAIIAALAADKLGRPCRFVLPREVDVDITGHRHSVSAAYTVDVDGKTGRIERAAVECNYNAGFSWDLSESWGLILSMRIDGGYTLRNVSARQGCGSGSESRFFFWPDPEFSTHRPCPNSSPFRFQTKEKKLVL